MKSCVEKCLNQVIISCQAYEGTPLYGVEYMKKMVESAVMGGAKAVRSCWPENIAAAHAVSKDLIIIGINKVGRTEDDDDPDKIFITPTFESARDIIEAGADIIAVETRIVPSRGKQELLDLLKQIHDTYPQIGIMADSAAIEDAMIAVKGGYVDIASTTLSEMVRPMKGPDLAMIRELKAQTDLPVNAEGRIWELADIAAVREAGCDMLTIGTAVTRPQIITKRFIDYNNSIKH